MTLLFTNPKNASDTLGTFVSTNAKRTIMEVTPSGIFSHTNMTTIKTNRISVMATGLILSPPFFIQSDRLENSMDLIHQATVPVQYIGNHLFPLENRRRDA